MDATRGLRVLLVTSLLDNFLLDLAVQSKVPQTAIGHDIRRGLRSSKEMKAANGNDHGLDVSLPELKTAGQKWSSDEYHTTSSQTSFEENGAVDNSPVTAEIDVHPILTTDSPPFIIRSKYIRNSHAVAPGGYREETDSANDRPQYPIGHNNIAAPKWNRYDTASAVSYNIIVFTLFRTKLL